MHTIASKTKKFCIFQLQTGDFVYETTSQNSLQNEVSRLMRDSEIRESVDPLTLLQRKRKKQNEELIHMTLAVPLIEGIE